MEVLWAKELNKYRQFKVFVPTKQKESANWSAILQKRITAHLWPGFGCQSWVERQPLHANGIFNGSQKKRNLNNKEINSPLEKCKMNCRHHLFSICWAQYFLPCLHIQLNTQFCPFTSFAAFMHISAILFIALSSLVFFCLSLSRTMLARKLYAAAL